MKSLVWKKNKFTLENIAWMIALLIITRFIVIKGIGWILNTPFPSFTDQDIYLLAGKEFAESGLFMDRAPFYSFWLGLMYSFSGNDIVRLFHNEQIASIILMSFLMLILGWKYYDKWTGLFFFAWVWNCKYLLDEANGSHTFAAIFLIAALVLLSHKNVIFRTASILMLFLAVMCRTEMWIVLFIFSGISVFYFFLKAKGSNHPGRNYYRKLLSGFIIFCSVCLIILIYFKSNRNRHEPARFPVAFCQNFSVNYVERHNLHAKYPYPWKSYPLIWNEALPGANSPGDALKLYPREIAKHILYNMKLAVIALPASVFGLVSRTWFVIIFLGWMISVFVTRRKNSEWKFNPYIKFLLLSTLVLIPISFVMKVAMRYYEQLVPGLMILFAFLAITLADKTRLYLIKRHSS